MSASTSPGAPEPGSLEACVYNLVLNDPAQDAVMSPIGWTACNRVRVRRSNRRMFELFRLQNAKQLFMTARARATSTQTPADVVQTQNTAMNEILNMPDVVTRMTNLATVVVGGDGATLAKIRAVDHIRYAQLIKQFGIQAD